MTQGKLIIVGSGICGPDHMTFAARRWIQSADRVLYLIGDRLTESLLLELNPRAEALEYFYDADLDRHQTYDQIVNLILGCLQMGETVCGVFYGHPGIFVNPSHDAIAKARAMGFEATMVPGISAEDCLFADLGIDPSSRGCQSYEATDFLARKRVFDPTAGLVLWQVDAIGDLTGACMDEGYRPPNVDVLVEVLAAAYGPEHVVVIYEAATDPATPPRRESVPLRELVNARLTTASTLYVPPKGRIEQDRDTMRRLGMDRFVRDR